MSISEETIEALVFSSRISLEKAKSLLIKEELTAMVMHLDVLKQADTEGVEPLIHVFPMTNVTRTDEVITSGGREPLLRNAAVRTDEAISVPRTVD